MRAVPLVALLVGLSMPEVAHAQVLIGMLLGDKVASDRFHVGFDFGANLSFLSALSGGPSVGPDIGLLGEWRFSEHGFLHVEFVATAALGSKRIPADELDPPPEAPPDLTDVLAERKLTYVGLPVLVKAGLLGNRLHLGLGAELLVLTGARDVYTGTAREGLELHEKMAKELSRIDVGPVAMVEVKLWDDPYAIGAAVRYYQGFVNVERGTDRTVWNSAVTVGLMLALGKPPKCPDCGSSEGEVPENAPPSAE